MQEYGYETVGVGDADLHRRVLKVRLAVVMVAQIELLRENLVEQGTGRKLLLAARLAAGVREVLQLVVRNSRRGHQLFLGFRNLPDIYPGVIVEFFFQV